LGTPHHPNWVPNPGFRGFFRVFPVFWGFRGVPETLFTAPHVQTVQILYHKYNVLYSFVQNGSVFSKVDFHQNHDSKIIKSKNPKSKNQKSKNKNPKFQKSDDFGFRRGPSKNPRFQ